MDNYNQNNDNSKQKPVFGFILFGGPLSGALVRDIRLANELARRGFAVHIWWAMDRTNTIKIDESITEHWLFHGLRYLRTDSFFDHKFLEVRELTGRTMTAMFRDERREHYLQKRQNVLRGTIQGLLEHIYSGVEKDHSLIRRFVRDLDKTGVTHVLPMLAALCPFIQAARQRTKQKIEYLVTFQGYELYLNYARMLGFEEAIHQRFIDSVDQSAYKAIGVSEDYCQRVVDDIGLSPDKITAIPPGVPGIESVPPRSIHEKREAAVEALEQRWGSCGWHRDRDIFTYIGRRDTEKGLDLLLYAAAIVKQKGIDIQIIIAGPTLFGTEYSKVIEEIAENLRLTVIWAGKISDELRNQLFTTSTAVIYPSIHREPFGMVPVEAIAHGTPAIVPNYGGVSHTIEANGKTAGLRFDVWNSHSLAQAMEKLATDKQLWQELSKNGPVVADYYSIKNLGARILKHLGIDER